MAHQWSGWPGCYCQKCGAEHALENALALNWFDINDDGQTIWKSEDHQKLVKFRLSFHMTGWMIGQTALRNVLIVQCRG